MKNILLGLLLLFVLPNVAWSEPVREQGISMQMLPERVARVEGRPWGFWVDYADYLMPEARQPVLQSAIQFSSYVKKQKPDVLANGVWILLFNPASYKDQEVELLRKVKSYCRKNELDLFVGYTTDQPVRWRRQ